MLRVCSQELLLSEREGGREEGKKGKGEREEGREGGKEEKEKKRGKRERGKEGERRREGRKRLREEGRVRKGGRINNSFLSHHLRRYLCQFLKLFFLDMHVFDWIQEWKTMRKTFLHFSN